MLSELSEVKVLSELRESFRQRLLSAQRRLVTFTMLGSFSAAFFTSRF